MTPINKDSIVWLGVYGHPDDETSASAGTMVKLSDEGHQVYVITATGGELGTLGTGGIKIRRSCLRQGIRIKGKYEHLRSKSTLYVAVHGPGAGKRRP